MQKAPNFSLLNQDDVLRTLEDYHGRWLVLYFYPKDNTPGCTTEACSFRDERDAIAELGNAFVVGVSADSVQSHKKFHAKYSLHFDLLSDSDHNVAEAYDSWKPKKFMGKEYLGVARNTFIITPDGYIAERFENVIPKTHATEIIKSLHALQESDNRH